MSANIVSKTNGLKSNNLCTLRVGVMLRDFRNDFKKEFSSLVIKESCLHYRESKGWWFHPRAHEIVMNHLEVIKNLSKNMKKH